MSGEELIQAVITFKLTLKQLEKLQRTYERSLKGGDSVIAKRLETKIKQAKAAQTYIDSSSDNIRVKVSQFRNWNRFLNEIRLNPSTVLGFGESVEITSLEHFSGLVLIEES